MVATENIESTQTNTTGIWNSVFIKMFIINTMAQYCTFTMNALSAVYADHLGAAATIVGLVSGLFASTALIFKLISGPAIDAFNRKYVLVGSLFILLVSFVGYSISTTIPLLIISRLVTGVGLAFMAPCCITIASDALPIGKMGTGIGFFAMSIAICQGIAPAAGLKMVDLFGYRITFTILAVLMAFTIIVAATAKVSFTPVGKFKFTMSSIFAKEALIPSALLLLLNVTWSAATSFVVLFGILQGIASDRIGYFFAIVAGTMMFTRPIMGKLSDDYGAVRVIMGSMACFAVSFLLISYSRTLPMFLLAGFLAAFGCVGCQPTLVAACMKSVPMTRRGAASCTSYIGQDIGNLVGPILAGAIVESLGYVSMWRIMIFPMCFVILIAIFFRNQLDSDQNAPAT